jgi:hypothetical protein
MKLVELGVDDNLAGLVPENELAMVFRTLARKRPISTTPRTVISWPTATPK